VVTQEFSEVIGDTEKIVRSRVKLMDWMAQLMAQEGHTEFLPPVPFGHIVARQTKGQRSCVVVQLPPAVRSFMYSETNRLYRVAMPYVVLVVNFVGQAIDCIYWYYRNETIVSLDDQLFWPNMPNVYANGKVCMGSEKIPLSANLAQKVDMVVQVIFASHFNHHEIECQWKPSVRSITGHPQSFEEWETRSTEDPTFILKLDWRPAGISIQQALERGVKQ